MFIHRLRGDRQQRQRIIQTRRCEYLKQKPLKGIRKQNYRNPRLQTVIDEHDGKWKERNLFLSEKWDSRWNSSIHIPDVCMEQEMSQKPINPPFSNRRGTKKFGKLKKWLNLMWFYHLFTHQIYKSYEIEYMKTNCMTRLTKLMQQANSIYL